MAIEVRQVISQKQLREYIFLPGNLYSGYAQWVPPMYADEWAFHDPRLNPSLAYADVVHFMAFEGLKPVGRIMGIIHRKYNEQKHEKTARFFNFDCVHDSIVAAALIGSIEKWALANGMNKLIGPYGFSDKDPQGLQVEGYENLAVIGTPSHPPYLVALVEGCGFTKEIDCVSYTFPVPQKLPELYEKIAMRFNAAQYLRVIEFKKKKELRPFIIPVLELVNETYLPLFGFVAMTKSEMKKLADQYMPVLDPELVKLIVNDKNEVVAFVIAMPELSIGIQKAKGRLFPFGFIHILNAARKTNQMNLMLGAVKPGFRGIGMNVLLAKSLFATGAARGFTKVDSHLILENNLLMRAECERLGGKIYKRYRVFQKVLNQ